MRARKGEAWFAALLLAVACLPHLAALRAGFTYDDRVFVVRNQSIRSLGGALGAFGSPFPPEQPERALYRPLTNFSYALDHALSGGEPAVFHATNLLLYLGIAWLAYRVARRSLATRGGARAAALIFAVHPVHCEVVDSVAGRSELLALALGLSALLLFRAAVDPAESASGGQRGRTGRLAAAYLCYALATLAKESAIVLPALLAAHCLLFPAAKTSGRRVWGTLVPFVAIAAGCLLLRGWVLGAATPAVTVLGDEPLATRFFTLGAIYWEYLRLLFFPATLQVDFYYAHRVGIHATLSPTALAGLAVLAGSLATLAALLAQASRRSARPADRGPDRAAAFGLLFFLIYLFPVSHVVPFGALLAERFLFAPSLGFALAAAAALEAMAARTRNPSLRRALAGGLALALALAALRGGARAAEWRNPVTLWSPVVRQVPGEFRAYNNLAAGYLELGQPERAVTALRRSLELEPGNPAGLNNLGHALLQAARHAEAHDVYRRVVAEHPDNHVAWNSLGAIEARRGRLASAREHYRRALALNPNYATARANLEAAERGLERARRFLAAPAPPADGDAELRRLRAGACRAVGDVDCEDAARVLAERPERVRAPRSRATPDAR